MKSRFASVFLLVVGLSVFGSYTANAQLNVMHSFNHVVSEPEAWVKAGTLSLPQQGENAFIKFYAGSGFNAASWQNGYVELFIRTSNGSSLDNEGYAFSAVAAKFGESVPFMQSIRIVPNAAGASATAYDIYFYSGHYTGVGFYHVMAGNAASWTHAMVQSSPPAGMNVPFQFRTVSDTYLGNGTMFISRTNSNVGIGTTNPQAKLAVNGDIRAQKVKVTQAGWPDYVFEPTYSLPSLAEVESHIKQHRHLPGIPSAATIQQHGLDVGEQHAALLKKVEELTLYIIDLNKKLEAQQQEIKQQRRLISTLKQ